MAPQIVAYTYLFRTWSSRGVYALPCPGVIYLAQVLVWALGALPRPLSYLL
jgi:hypothetical protein